MSIEDIGSQKMFSHSMSLSIDCQVDRLWTVMCDRIDDWWPDDFRALGPGSHVSLVPTLGGGLWEKSAEGAGLEWYRVQMCVPGQSLYLVGYLAPDWGGPTLTMVKIAMSAEGQGSQLTLSESLLGNVTQKSCETAQSGWQDLLGKGLRSLAEKT